MTSLKISQDEQEKNYLNLSYGELDKAYMKTVYDKGKIFLYNLMKEMGEDIFYSMMQEYYKTYAFGEAATVDFRDIVEKNADQQNQDAVKELLDKNLRH